MNLSKLVLICALLLLIENQVNAAYSCMNLSAIHKAVGDELCNSMDSMTEQPDNRIPIDVLDTDGDGSVTISTPGSYYLRDTLYVTQEFGDGITISSDNVSIDLNGFAIIAGPQITDDGINVNGSQEYITIKNGSIIGFGGDGLNGFNADFSTFENLYARDNGEDGISADFSCLIINCFTINNGSDGIRVDDGSIIRNCTTAFNGNEGIETSNGCIVTNCTSYKNGTDGIALLSGSRVEHCTVYENSMHGLDISKSVLCINNLVYRNGWNGIDLNNNALVINNVSNNNGTCIENGSCGEGTNGQGTNEDQGAGISMFANAMVLSNQCNGNYFGIVAKSIDCLIIKNNLQNNSHAGILATANQSLYLKNSAENNGFQQSPSITDIIEYPSGNIVFSPGDFETSSVGPIIDVSTIGDISTLMGADHPFANFLY
ncbi:MAG: right-handed parallel beta-helix repeat-containing protein [Saprospiraceae bacterium]|nr:right-handed parallel beta-helix repeat-containing protein [Saprospiraceae bacterium]